MEKAFRLIIRWPLVMKRAQRAKKTVWGGERNWDRERESSETLCSSTSCYFNPDSALKCGHHVASSKSVAPALAEPIRGEVTVQGGGTLGGSASLWERGIKACEHRRRVRAREATSPGELDYPQTNGDRSDLIPYSSCISHWNFRVSSMSEHSLRQTVIWLM